jgi:nucleoside-diphosphate-sugar epimerase
MKILLAGATGTIGRTLLPLLVQAGHDVAGMSSEAGRAAVVRSLGGRPVVVDVFDRDGLAASVPELA